MSHGDGVTRDSEDPPQLEDVNLDNDDHDVDEDQTENTTTHYDRPSLDSNVRPRNGSLIKETEAHVDQNGDSNDRFQERNSNNSCKDLREAEDVDHEKGNSQSNSQSNSHSNTVAHSIKENGHMATADNNGGEDSEPIEVEEEISPLPAQQSRPHSPSAASTTSSVSTSTSSKKSLQAAVCRDPSLNDALLQLQLLLTAHIGRSFGIIWPSESVAAKLVEIGFPATRVNPLVSVTLRDIERGLDQVLNYLAFLLRDRTGTVVPMCKVLLRVREQAVMMDPETTKRGLRRTHQFASEKGLSMESLLFSTLNELLAGVSAAAVLEDINTKGEALVNSFVDISFEHFSKYQKTAEPSALEPCIALIGRLSWFSLPRTLHNFSARMNKVYFNASALEFVPFMQILTNHVKFSLDRTSGCRAACLAFVQSIAKLLKTTSCAELIEEVFRCVVCMMARFRDEWKPQRLPRQGSSSSSSVYSSSSSVPSASANAISTGKNNGADDPFGPAYETIFGYAHSYASRGRYLPSSLNAMESMVSWQVLETPHLPLLSTQHDRLCSDLVKRIDNAETRISGLDHMQRYFKLLPRNCSYLGLDALFMLPKILFIDSAIPRAQEAALISALIVELGRCFPRIFDETMTRGLTNNKATSAQRAICLSALSKVLAFFPVPEEKSPLRGYTKFVVSLSGRDSPAVTVAEAVACFPMLGMHSEQMLQNCVDSAFGFDMTLVDAGRDALIRFCQHGDIYAEKAIMVTVESPSLKLICTMQHTKAPQDTPQILISVITLERVLCAALDKGFSSAELIAEAGASLLLASTYPDAKVQARANLALDRIGLIRDPNNENPCLRRALDKLLLGLLGASGSADSCGGARVQELNRMLARKPGFCDFVVWWRNQCTLICAAEVQHSNKPSFVRSLVHEYLTATNNRLQSAALISLAHLKDCHDVIEKKIAMQSLQARNEIYNGLFIRLMAALRETYYGGPLERRIHQMVRTWIQSSNDEIARLHMAKWSPHVVEAAARLLRKFVLHGQLHSFPDADVARDQGILLIQEWRRVRERAPRLAAVSDAFVTLLDSGHLKSVAAQSYALKMLSRHGGSKNFQQFGFRALLRQNLDAMLKHYYEAVLRSFDPPRWANDQTSTLFQASGNDRHFFMVNIASAVLHALDISVSGESELAAGLKPQMAVLVSLLFVHPEMEMRKLVASWVPHSAFLGLPDERFTPALVSNKLSGLERAVLVSQFLAKYWDGCIIDEIVQGAAKVSPYLNEYHISCLLHILAPWLVHQYPQGTRQPQRLITRLLRLCTRLPPGGDDPAWRIWRSINLTKGLDDTVRTLVDYLIKTQPAEHQTAALDAISTLFSHDMQLGSDPVDTLSSLVRSLPPMTWSSPEEYLHESIKIKASDAREGTLAGLSPRAGSPPELRTEAQIKDTQAVLRLVNRAPFITRNFKAADLARTLYAVFIEEGVDKQLSLKTVQAINEEFEVARPAVLLHFESEVVREDQEEPGSTYEGLSRTMSDGGMSEQGRQNIDGSDNRNGEWLSTISFHSQETMSCLTKTIVHCLIYCKEPMKRVRAFTLLQSVSTSHLDHEFIHDLVLRIESRCTYLLKLLEFGNGNSATHARLEALEHLFILAEWVASAPDLARKEQEDLVIIATCALSIPLVIRPNPFARIRISALKILQSLASMLENSRTDRILQEHLVACLVNQEVASLSAEILLGQDCARGALEPAIFVLITGAICLVQYGAQANSVNAEKQMGLASQLVKMVTPHVSKRPEVKGLLDQLSARLMALLGNKASAILARARSSSSSSQYSQTEEESLALLAKSVITREAFVQSFVVVLLRGSGLSSGQDQGYQAVVQFLVQILEVGSETMGMGALLFLSECFKHHEISVLLLEEDNSLLDIVMDGLIVALETWPKGRRVHILNVMAGLRLKPTSSFDFVHAESSEQKSKQDRLVRGLGLCRAQLEANLDV